MNKRHFVKYIYEGDYVAEVEIDLTDTAEGWSPYLSLEDVEKLDEVGMALRSGDLKLASRHSRIYQTTPVPV